MFQLTNKDADLYLRMIQEMAEAFSMLEDPEEELIVGVDDLKNLLHVNDICKEVTGEALFSVEGAEIKILEVEDEGARQLFLNGYIPFTFVQDFEPVRFVKAKKYNDKIWINVEEGLICS